MYYGVVISNTHVAMPVIDDEETLILEEESRSKMVEKAKDPEVVAKKISHKPIDYGNLNSLIDDFGKLFSLQQEFLAEQAFWFPILNPTIEPSYTPPVIVDVPSELPKVSLVNVSLKKLKFHLTQFDSVVKKRITPSALEEEYFVINDLKARLQDKDTTICKLKDTMKSLEKNTKEKNVHHEKCDLEPSKGKEIVENGSQIPSATTIAPSMFKLDLVPLSPSELDFACKYATRIQELLVYVQDTCPNAITPSSKKIVVTPMNNVKTVKFAEPITSSSKTQQVESSKTLDSNTHVLSSTRVKCSTSNCGSKPPGNKKNDRILQKPSRNKKNNVEDQPRKVNKLNRVAKHVCDVDVKHSLSNANSKSLCVICNKSMFDSVHDKCLLDFLKNGNNHTKSAKNHTKQNIWKLTGHVFTELGYK
ncbi:hypothetical protein Tco_0184509 [Tanacetum coccineum]